MSNSWQPHELQHAFRSFSSCSSTGFYVPKRRGTFLLQNIFSRGNCGNRVEKRFEVHFFFGHSKSLQSCPTLCDPMDCSPSGSSIHGILQARILGWVAISFSRGSSPPRDQTMSPRVSCIGRWVLYHCATWEASYSPKAFNGPSNKD